jgi:hypothetical protein
MQEMDCRSFKDMLDSYLSQELAVETNHAMLRHAECCGVCRTEMAARRRLRETLRRACLIEKMSDETCERLRLRLRADIAGAAEEREVAPARPKWLKAPNWPNWITAVGRILPLRFALPSALTVVSLIFVVGALSLFLLKRREPSRLAVELSPALFDESAGDHRMCATLFVNATAQAAMPESVKKYDPAYVALDQIAEAGAQGLRLRAAHVCGYGGRRFAHLVYTGNWELISLLVTERDDRALKLGKIPTDDSYADEMQQALREQLALGAYQTAKHIVLVVSNLPEKENVMLAERLAAPVTEYLRRVERTSRSGFQSQPGCQMTVSFQSGVRGGRPRMKLKGGEE